MDNLCQDDTPVPSVYHGNYTINRFSSAETAYVVVNPGDPSFRYCNQDLFRSDSRKFPFTKANQPEGDEWMTEEQEKVTIIFGWASIAVFGVMALSFFQGWAEEISHWVWGETTVRLQWWCMYQHVAATFCN